MRHLHPNWKRSLGGVALAASLCLLAACSTTGESFRSSGLNHIVEGRTTFQQAVTDLGTEPVDTWQQGDTLLARWAYKGTVATDAVYFRQEVWLRFGADGRFLRTERAINVPLMNHTRTAAEADREAAERARRRAPAARTAAAGTATPDGSPSSAGAATQSMALPVPPPPAIEPVGAGSGMDGGASAASGQAATSVAAPPGTGNDPLLPAGTRVIPGASYPLGGVSQ